MTQDQHKLEPFEERHLPHADVSAQPQWAFSRSKVVEIVQKRDAQWSAHLQQRPLPVREGADRDAERYRWLRDTGYWYTSLNGSPWAVFGTGAGDASPCCGQELDAAIDAGIADTPPVASPSVQNMGEGETGKDGVALPLKGQPE